MLRSFPSIRWFVFVLAVGIGLGGCSGTQSGSPGGGGTTPEQAELPPSDRGLQMWARSDAPPFPIDELPAVLGPPGQSLPPEQLARIAAFIRWYERDPYDPRANGWESEGMSTRAALLAWVTESPDVMVVVTPTLGPLAAARGEDAEAVGVHTTLGSALGMAAHAIEHPGLDPQDPVRQAEGIASGLRWYEAAVKRGADRIAFLDELIAIRDRGELATWFSERVTLAD